MTKPALVTSDGLTAARLRSVSRLARAYGHEIRGAQSSLAIHAELLSRSLADVDDPALRARQERYVRVFGTERLRVQRLVDVLLSSLVTLDDETVEAFDLGEVLAGVHALVAPQSTERRAPLDVAPPGPTPMIGRRRIVEQGVLDVLLWTLDRVPAGVTIGVAVSDDAECVRIHIDAGGGLQDGAGGPSLDACDAVLQLAGGSVHQGPADGYLEVALPRTVPGDHGHDA